MTFDADSPLPQPSGDPFAAALDVPTAPAATGTVSAPMNDPGDDELLDERVESDSGARAFVEWIVVIAVAITVAILVRNLLLAHFVVEGSSMDSTLTTGDRVFVNKMSYRLHDPNRGDVVVLHQINGSAERDLIKRVIGLPGEIIEMTNCEVRITEAGDTSSKVLSEPYLDRDVISSTCGGDFSPVSVPADHVFVMGDNRSGSQDSRSLGPIAEEDLVGRAFVVFWPRADWRWL